MTEDPISTPAEAQPVACDEDRFEQFLRAAILQMIEQFDQVRDTRTGVTELNSAVNAESLANARSPEPLRELGEYLAGVLDDDQWPAADRLLLQLATTSPRARPWGVDDAAHVAMLRSLRLMYADGAMEADDHPGTIAALDAAIAALAQQPAAVDDTRRLEYLIDNELLVRRLSDTGLWMVTTGDLTPAIDGSEYDTWREAIDAALAAQQGGEA